MAVKSRRRPESEVGGKKLARFETGSLFSIARIAFWNVLAAVVAVLLFVLAWLPSGNFPPA